MQYKSRRNGLLLVLMLAMVGWIPPAAAQDMTAADLLQRGLEQIDAGSYQQAQQTLQRIDPVQLNDEQQDRLEAARGTVSQALVARQALRQAEAAREKGNVEQARRIYNEITGNQNIPRDLRAQAAAALRGLAADSDAQPAPDNAEDADDADDDQPSADEQVLRQARQLVAQQLVVKGRRSMNQNQPNRAASLFKQALQINPDNVAAQEGLARAETAQAQMQTDVGDWPGNLPEMLGIERQRVEATYKRRMEEARKAFDAGNYEKARQAALLARSAIDDNRNLFDEKRWTELRQQATDLAQKVNQEADQQRVDQVRQEQAAAEEQSEQARRTAERETKEKIHRLLQRATELSRQRRYDRALEQIEQVLFIEPRNVSARFMRDMIQEQKVQLQWHELKRERSREIAQHRVANMEQTIPISDLITYPPDWPQLTRMRLGGMTEGEDSEANRLAREKLRQMIPVDFSGNDLASVIEYFRRVTGAEIVPQWRQLEAAGVTRDTPITIRLQNVAAEKALELVLNEAGGELVTLDYSIDEGVIIIADAETLKKNTEIRTYDIKDLLHELPDFGAQSPQIDIASTTSDDDGDGDGGIFDDVDDRDTGQSAADITADVMDLIRRQVAPDTWQQLGGLDSSMEELNGTLIVRTTAESHREIASLLEMLREQRALQIAVESRFLFVTQNFLEAVGMDVDLTIEDADSDVFVGNPTIQQSTIESSSPPSTAVDGSLGGEDFVPSLAFGAATGSGVGSLGFLLDDLRVDLLVRATQQNVRNILVNTPRVTFFNNRSAFVSVTREFQIISDLEPTVAEDSVALSPETEPVFDGVVLQVAGTISADRRYVTLNVEPTLTQIIRIRRVDDIPAGGVGGDGDDDDDDDDDDDGGGGGSGDVSASVEAIGFIQLPETSTTQIKTSVSVPDKGTLLIGGQRLVGEVEVQSGVPVLSKIPVINRLFTNRSKVRDERTLLILIKPTIIVQSEHEERRFPGMMQSPELYNLGNQR